MNEHPFEATPIGKVLLLVSKLVMPLVIIALLTVTPTLIPRRVVFASYILDFLMRLAATGFLVLAYWKLPDFEANDRGRSRHFWQEIASLNRGRLFQPVYIAFSAVVTLAVVLVTGFSLRAFLPGIGLAGWLLAGLAGGQFAALYALQYQPFRRVMFPSTSLNAAAPYRPRAARIPPPASVRGVVTPRRKPYDPGDPPAR